MVKRIIVGALAALVVVIPGFAGAQEAGGGLAIDHKAVGCIVAGKFAKMNACFAPNSNVARARVYFRAEGGTSWYYVEMKSDAPCLAGILPKARKELVDKHVDYYVQVTDKSFTESRTEEYTPIVVASESGCSKDKLLATSLSKAAVQVFPSLPAGFAAGAGISTAAAVGAGAAVAGAAGGVYAATKSNSPTTTLATPTTTSPTAGGTTTTTTPTTTTPPSTNGTATPVFIFNMKVSPTQGTEPLDVTIDMCASSPETSLRYFYDFDGDGVFDFQGPFCSQTRTYNVHSVNMTGIVTSPPTTQSRDWTVTGCAEPRNPAVQPQERRCQSGTVHVDSKPPATTLPSGSNLNTRSSVHLVWGSELNVEGAAGQVVVNGTAAVFSAAGRSDAVAAGRKGQNRFEAQLVQAKGKAGTWRFDLSRIPDLVSGSLRVIAGDVATVTPGEVVFRMRGTAGERVVFSFESGR